MVWCLGLIGKGSLKTLAGRCDDAAGDVRVLYVGGSTNRLVQFTTHPIYASTDPNVRNPAEAFLRRAEEEELVR